jgi:F0F1-type ATP synthase assembly protein I
MDKQSVLMLALATLFVAGIVVGVCGWMLFARTKPSPLSGAGAEAKTESHPEPGAS